MCIGYFTQSIEDRSVFKKTKNCKKTIVHLIFSKILFLNIFHSDMVDIKINWIKAILKNSLFLSSLNIFHHLFD